MSPKRKLFGTDGIRGTANITPVTAEIAMKVGMAAGKYFMRGDYRHRVVIAKDTRLSGYMVEPALTSGFVSVGMDVVLVGPMPTPAVAQLVKSLRADMGVMISASHNPFHDNGIKLFGPDGYKLSDFVESKIEEMIDAGTESYLTESEKLGRAKRLDDAPGRYIEFVKSTFPKGMRLDGLKIVVDCANGASYHIAPKVFWELGAEVIPLSVEPNGFNINKDCGSTHPEQILRAVVEHKADIGISLDGDADRVVIADEKGNLIDGDQLIAMIASYWQRMGMLRGGGVVGTVMTNLGMERHLNSLGLNLIRSKVGDRYVVEDMKQHNMNVGGEQSGHIILSDYGTTGDGIVAALQVLAVMLENNKPLSQVGRVFEPMPQVMVNVKYQKGRVPLEETPVINAIEEAEKLLNNKGRLVVRKSGTEPLIRVMAEGEDKSFITDVVNNIAEVIKANEDNSQKVANG